MVSVPVPLTCEAEARGIVMLFCCALAPRVEAKAMAAVGRGTSKPWPLRVNFRLSTVKVPWKAVPDCGVNETWNDGDCPEPICSGNDKPMGPMKPAPDTVTAFTVRLLLFELKSKRV